MTREIVRGFVSPVRHAAMQQGRRLLLCAAMVLVAVSPAFGSPGRMVYVNGEMHRIWIGGGRIQHQTGKPTDPVNGTGDFVSTAAAQQGYSVCRSKILAAGEGLAVFRNKIYHAYTADTTCGSASQSAFVATYNLTTAQWERNHQLGTITTNNKALGSVSGAAITVFDDKLYAFTIGGVYTSNDGEVWTWYPALPQVMGRASSPDYQPLDAVAVYPPTGDARILIVFGTQFGVNGCSGGCNYFDTLYAETWNGKFGSSLQLYNPRNIYGRTDGTGPWTAGRVSLMPGTKGATSPYVAGTNLNPAVQLFGQKMSGSSMINLEYNVAADTWTGIGTGYGGFSGTAPSLMVYPWYVLLCSKDHPALQSRKQRLVALGSSNGPLGFDSDHMVPQNVTDSQLPPSCPDPTNSDPTKQKGSTGGTRTYTGDNNSEDPLHIRRDYWSLVGVILGGPPFVLNKLEPTNESNVKEIGDLSFVSYGTSETSTVKQKQKWVNSSFVSAGATVHAGFFDDALGIESSFDVTYEHEYKAEQESAFTEEKGSQNYIGTANYTVAGAPTLGKTGSAIFLAPTVVVQDYALFAYDYDYVTGTGHALDQDLTVIEAKHDELSIIPVTFGLNPAEAPRDSVFDGMEIFQDSTDLNYWTNPKDSNGLPWNWESDPRWKMIYGTGKVTPLTFSTGHNKSESFFTQTTETVVGEEKTSSVSFENENNVSLGTKLKGIKLSLSAGLTKSFSTGVTTSTGFGTELKMNLGIPTCAIPITKFSISSNVVTFTAVNSFAAGDTVTVTDFNAPYSFFNGQRLTVLADGLSSTQFKANFTNSDLPLTDQTGYVLPPECELASMSVQPFFLQANLPVGDSPVAPWVPKAYRNQQPWCITWQVTDVDPPLPTGVMSTFLGRARAATGLAPLNASGRIVSGSGGDDGGGPYSHYFIQGGQLQWVNASGITERIPMTADEFVPSRGVSFEVHGSSWSSLGTEGSWTRSGNVWTFQPNDSVEQNRVMVRLDFGSATYDLQIQQANLARIPAGVRDLVLAFTVNQQYTFLTALQHDIDIAFHWSRPAPDALKGYVTSFEGRYNSATQSGRMSVAGTLPAQLDGFGDIGLDINGHRQIAQLINLEGFQRAFETGGSIRYAKEGLIVAVDFGRKTWSATFNGKAFNQLLAPRLGSLRTRILVGGAPLGNSDNAVLDYSANLKLRR